MANCIICAEFDDCPWRSDPDAQCSGFKQKPQTNADRIRAMSDEELAMWIERIRMLCANDACGRACPLTDICLSNTVEPTETINWLKQEVNKDG